MSSTNSLMFHHRWSTDKFIRIFILTTIICVTFVGNLFIIFKLLSKRHRTRLQLFILNLAIGDLTICGCTMSSELFLLIYDQEWILGNVSCKLILYIQVVTLASTTFINVAMTHDRYDAVSCPFRTCHSTGHARFIILLCWLCSFIVAIPQLFIFQRSLITGSSSQYRCASTGYTAEWQRRIYFTIFTTYVLIIPTVCMTVWYVKIIRIINASKMIWTKSMPDQTLALSKKFLTAPTKIKTIKLALTIILVFVVCWTPYMLITLIEIYSNGYFQIPSWLEGVLQTICFIQSSLNPFIYMTFSQRETHHPALVRTLGSTFSQISKRNYYGSHQSQIEQARALFYQGEPNKVVLQ